MTLADDETIAEQVSEQSGDTEQTKTPGFSPASSSLLEPTPTPVPLESGMETGQGADDEPELAIGDRHTSDAIQATPEEARRMLGGKEG